MKRWRPCLSRWERIWLKWVGSLTFVLLLVDLFTKGHG